MYQPTAEDRIANALAHLAWLVESNQRVIDALRALPDNAIAEAHAHGIENTLRSMNIVRDALEVK
jgi:hypothetical protein